MHTRANIETLIPHKCIGMHWGRQREWEKELSAVRWRGVWAHQVVQDADGKIKHAHLDRLSESSVQIEQRLGLHASVGTLRSTRGKFFFLKKRELPTTDLSLCLSLKTGRIHRNRRGTPPRCSSSFQVPTTALPPLFLVSSFLSPSASSAPSPGNVLTVSSCFLVSASSGGVSQLLSCCATAAERFPFLQLRLKGAVATKKNEGELPPVPSAAAAI